jgi:hypothetical protein
MIKAEWDLKGLRDAEEALKELPKATARNTLLRAGKEPMDFLASRMAVLAPYDPADRDENGLHLRDTMRSQPAKAKLAAALGVPRKSGAVVLAGPAPKGGRMRLVAWYLENGTGPRYHKSGKGVGMLPPDPYVRPAVDANAETVIRMFTVSIANQINKTIERLARKASRMAAKGR